METGPAKKLVVYIRETDKYQGVPAYEALIDWLKKHGVSGATATRAVGGFGAESSYHRPSALHLTENLPVRIEVVETASKISSILPFVYDMVGGNGLIEILDTQVVAYPRKREAEPRPSHEHIKLEGRAEMLRIYVDEDDEWEGEPLYEAIVKTLRMMDMAGATVYRGIMGYGAQQRVHKSGFLGISGNLPVMITIVDTEEKIGRAIVALDDMVDEGLVVLSGVDVIKYTHREPSEHPK
jgi:PII-like signaling protein